MYTKPKKQGSTRFTAEQVQFLLGVYDRVGARNNEKQAWGLMKQKFNLANGNKELLLSQVQIKSWFSAETARRKKRQLQQEEEGRRTAEQERSGGTCLFDYSKGVAEAELTVL